MIMGRRPRITDEQRKQVLQYREEGFNYEEIAELVGCGRESARRICHGSNYPKYQRDSRRRKKRTEVFETLSKIEPTLICDYLKSIGFKGELIQTITKTRTLKI